MIIFQLPYPLLLVVGPTINVLKQRRIVLVVLVAVLFCLTTRNQYCIFVSGQDSITPPTTTDQCRDESLYSNRPCSSWTEFIGNYYNNVSVPYQTRIVIPCGVCVKLRTIVSTSMNTAVVVQPSNLTFDHGLDVQGKLWIDCSNDDNETATSTTSVSKTIYIHTTMLLVQGLLVINASCKAVDGNPYVVVNMKSIESSNSTTSFVPLHDSIKVFCPTGICESGSKSITVAGGKVDLVGIPPDTPSWLNLYDVVYTPGKRDPTSIVVDASIKNKWNVGATILITGFTTIWNKYQQVRTITAINDFISSNISNVNDDTNYTQQQLYVELKLNSSIVRPTTLLDHPDFAVEVALLSKNIVFTSSSSTSTSLFGGHFWIFHTSNIVQTIIGIQIQQFGQQGLLGRYPIHLHHCSDSSGTIVAKNTIQQSFQRCIVIHGTNNVQVHDNVAYDTFGHCYVLEDGIEYGNAFIRNLGVVTKRPMMIIPNNPLALNGNETDSSPSTFWITNSNNTFVQNVAGGSQNNGYWFELLKRGIYQHLYPTVDPKRNVFGTFQDNIAHSNIRGLRTYPSGYTPIQTATITRMKVYRNVLFGMLFHASSNIRVEHCIFADNGVGIHINRNRYPPIQLYNVTIIGETQSFQNNVRNKRYDDVCHPDGYNIGIHVNTRKTQVGSIGTIWDTIHFYGYEHNTCTYVSPISMTYLMDEPIVMFDLYTTIQGMNFTDPITGLYSNYYYPLDFCQAQARGIQDIYLTDLDGSLRPTIWSEPIAPSTILSLTSDMTRFIDKTTTNCYDVPFQCLTYCQNICFRGILFGVEPTATTKGYTLRICDKIHTSNCKYQIGYRYLRDDIYNAKELRYFPIYVPIGQYDAVFIDTTTGIEVWPTFTTQYVVDTSCPILSSDSSNSQQQHSITLYQPPVMYETCIELIRNGNAETSTVEATYWLTDRTMMSRTNTMNALESSSLQVLIGSGINGTNAIASVENNVGTSIVLIQYLDPRCFQFMKNAIYRVTAHVKIVKRDGTISICSATTTTTTSNSSNSTERCPEIGISTDRYTYLKVVARGSVRSSDGYELLQGDFRIPDKIPSNSNNKIKVYIQSFHHQLIVDNVSIQLINETNYVVLPSPSAGGGNTIVVSPTAAPTTTIQDPLSCTNNMIANSNMELGYIGYWSPPDKKKGMIDTITPGYISRTALKYNKTNGFQYGPMYLLSMESMTRCLTSTTIQLNVTVQIRLFGRDTKIGANCNIQTSCPMVIIKLYDKSNAVIVSSTTRSYQTSIWNKDGYNLFEKIIDLPSLSSSSSWQDTIGGAYIGIGNFSSTRELIWDDFRIIPISTSY